MRVNLRPYFPLFGVLYGLSKITERVTAESHDVGTISLKPDISKVSTLYMNGKDRCMPGTLRKRSKADG